VLLPPSSPATTSDVKLDADVRDVCARCVVCSLHTLTHTRTPQSRDARASRIVVIGFTGPLYFGNAGRLYEYLSQVRAC
jgi:hypothetical protein